MIDDPTIQLAKNPAHSTTLPTGHIPEDHIPSLKAAISGLQDQLDLSSQRETKLRATLVNTETRLVEALDERDEAIKERDETLRERDEIAIKHRALRRGILAVLGEKQDATT